MNNKEIKNIVLEGFYEASEEKMNGAVDVELANRLLNDPNNEVVWRLFKPEQENSIFTNGYSSEYFGDGEGSYHGVGVYAFYRPYGAEKRWGGQSIGNRIMKCVLLGGFKDFLILDAAMAKKYYQSDDITTQLDILYDNQEVRDKIKRAYISVKGNTRLHYDRTTGYISKALYEKFKSTKLLRAGKTRGIVYNGSNDPHACLIFNPREIIPIAVTNERRLNRTGKDFDGWKVKLTKDLFDKTKKALDFHSVGERLIAKGLIRDYVKATPVNDCILVQLKSGKKTMYNLIEENFISNYGFKQCFGWEEYTSGEDTTYILPVVLDNGYQCYIVKGKKPGTYYFYKEENDFNYVMSLAEYDKLSSKGIIQESAGKSISVYHRTDRKSMEGIARVGFSREYTSKHANIAGPGIYITFSPEDSTRYTKGFGECMIRCELIGGLDNFLIPYGATIKGQTCQTPVVDQFKNMIRGDRTMENFKYLMPYLQQNSPRGVYMSLISHHDLGATTLRGHVYNYGCWAGVVADWGAVVPKEVSIDNGRTWKPILTKDAEEFMKSHGDTQFALNKFVADGIIKNTFGDASGNDIQSNQQFSHGYVRVILAANNKVSFYSADDDKIISMAGFDKGYSAEDRNGEIIIPVADGGKTYYIYKEENGEYSLYEEGVGYEPIRNSNGKAYSTKDYDYDMMNK